MADDLTPKDARKEQAVDSPGGLTPAARDSAERTCDIIWMLESDVFTAWPSGNVFPGEMTIYPNQYTPRPHIIDAHQLGICASDYSRSYVVNFSEPLAIGLQYSGHIGYLSKDQLANLKKLGDGAYHAALLVNGTRCSNVVPFQINAASPPPEGPSIRITGIPDEEKDIIAAIGIWMTPPNEGDTELRSSSVAFPDLEIDGILHKRTWTFWMGPDGPLRPHEVCCSIVEAASRNGVQLYTPPITPRRELDVQAIIRQYKSAITHISVDRTSERLFDAFFAKPK